MGQHQPRIFRIKYQIKPAIWRLIKPDLSSTFTTAERRFTKGGDHSVWLAPLQSGSRGRWAGA